MPAFPINHSRGLPGVTIQICSYNEGLVIVDTIARVCSLDWPRDRLFVQICDDSTDETSVKVVKKCVLTWKERGVNIVAHPNDRSATQIRFCDERHVIAGQPAGCR